MAKKVLEEGATHVTPEKDAKRSDKLRWGYILTSYLHNFNWKLFTVVRLTWNEAFTPPGGRITKTYSYCM